MEPNGFVEASSGLLLAWGTGAIIGPLIASHAMDAFGYGALFLVTAAVHGALFGFALYRIGKRDAPADDQKSEFVPSGIFKPTPPTTQLDPRSQSDASSDEL